MEITNKKILILSPHTDDAELGMGASIHKLCESNNAVYCAVFSACKKSVLPNYPEDILITECKASSKILGIEETNLLLYDFEVRTFNQYRQEILEILIGLKNKIQPEIVFMPCLNDLHQDHETIAQEGLRAYKQSTILCYDLPWNNFHFNANAFIQITEKNLTKKIDSIAQYQSQAHRPYTKESFILGMAQMRGVQSGYALSEAFELVNIKIN